MEKTTYYQLNKPEVSDPLRVADFNDNANKIDAALKNLNTAIGSKAEQSAVNKVAADLTGLIVMGTYDGTANSGVYDTTTQTITLGFQPRFLFVRNASYKGSSAVGDDWTPKQLAFATPDFPHCVSGGSVVVKITSTGFVAGGTNSYFNSQGSTYHYVAIR